MGFFGAGLTLGAVFWMYGRDLPSHASLAQYKPPTISRIYSGEGKLIDEFARERRLFTAAEDIPLSIKQAFISAEDKNFYSHPGYDLRGIIAAAVDAAAAEPLQAGGLSRNALIMSRTAGRVVLNSVIWSYMCSCWVQQKR